MKSSQTWKKFRMEPRVWTGGWWWRRGLAAVRPNVSGGLVVFGEGGRWRKQEETKEG